jgi:outer membrane protein assembly factor BamB
MLLAALAAVISPGLRGQEILQLPPPRLSLVPGSVEALIKQADEFVQDGQAEEAIAIVQRILARFPRQLIEDTNAARSGFSRYHPVASECQLWIASLSRRLPRALEVYREQVDPLAERWLSEARQNRDKVLLERIVWQLPNSSYGDQAMLLLGDMRLEEGDHAGARHIWQMIHAFLHSPGGSLAIGPTGISLWHALGRVDPVDPVSFEELSAVVPEGAAYHFPGSDIAPSDVLSRLVLASLLDGDIERTRWELGLLGHLSPESEGTIAGQTGRHVDLLASILASSSTWRELPDREWTTYAGRPSRQPGVSFPLDLRTEPAWSHPLVPQSASRDLLGRGQYRVAERVDALLSCHPVAWENHIFLHDGNQLLAYQVGDGKPAWGSEKGIIYTVPVSSMDPVPGNVVGVPRQTVTIEGGRLFARMGASVTAHARNEDLLTAAHGLVVGLDLVSEGKLLDGFPLRLPGDRWAFEGTPVSDGDFVYLLLRYYDEVRSQFFVASYSIESGRQRWQQRVCAAGMPSRGNWQEQTHYLLTLHEGTLFCNPGSGVVASLACQDGRLNWIVSYPRTVLEAGNARQTGQHVFRDLVPPLVDGSTLFCAPPDSDRLFALDLSSGRLIWQTAPGVAGDAKYLLGVVHDRLVASGDRLYWFDVYNGELREQFPRLGSRALDQPRPDPAGWGRGLIAAGRVYWPLEDKIMVFENGPEQVGWQRKQEIDLAARSATGGNLVPLGNRLFIVAHDRLYAFQNDR